MILKATTSALHVNFFVCVDQSYRIQSCLYVCIALTGKSFVPAFFLWSLLKNYLITLSILEKEIIVLEKVCKKSQIVDQKICANLV